MLSINMESLFSDEKDLIVQAIREATHNIYTYYNSKERTCTWLLDLGNDICDVCSFWTGKTYVGSQKEKDIENAFQSFFEVLMNLLLDMKHSANDYEKNVANAMLYQGTVYRYLGKNHTHKGKVVPIYNDIYVSWSKQPENHYLLSKLFGKITWISCEIKEPLYGIDLEVIGCSRANEQEVVFPTKEPCITEVKYI